MPERVLIGVIVSAIAFFTVFFIMPGLIKALEKRNLTVKDYNKRGGVMIPRPAGPALIIGILAAEITLYAFFPRIEIIAIMITTSLGFLVGLVDDRRVMGGWFKPVALAASALPILLLGAYETDLIFPLFGSVNIPILYLGLVVVMIPITGNTVNSIDVLNGVASGFMTIASFSLSISLFILQNYEIGIASLVMGFVSLALYKYHKFPSRIFPGDSGALTLGAMYGAIALVGQVEIVAAIAILPAVFNSFLFLSSMKRIVEHRQIKSKPVTKNEDFKFQATTHKDAPVTLVRLIVAGKPLTEKEVAFAIFKLGLFSGILAIITAFMMEVKI